METHLGGGAVRGKEREQEEPPAPQNTAVQVIGRDRSPPGRVLRRGPCIFMALSLGPCREPPPGAEQQQLELGMLRNGQWTGLEVTEEAGSAPSSGPAGFREQRGSGHRPPRHCQSDPRLQRSSVAGGEAQWKIRWPRAAWSKVGPASPGRPVSLHDLVSIFSHHLTV